MSARADAGAPLGPRIAAPPAAGVAALLVALLTTGMPARAQAPSAASAAVKLANPASRNCVAQGGSVSIESDGAGGRFGVCVFADNLQCEEWAMLRGECRNGGVKVTGYATPAARFCAISGGRYAVTAGSNTAAEQGTCTFDDGTACTAAAYFDHSCTRAPATAAANEIRARFACHAGRTLQATFVNGPPPSSVVLTLADGRTLSLPQVPSADGARYANTDESVVFWNKGNTAILQQDGRTTYDGCVAKP